MNKKFNIGDIVLIKDFVSEDKLPMKPHPFVIIDNNQGLIEGMEFNLVANMLGSYHNTRHKNFKNKFAGF